MISQLSFFKSKRKALGDFTQIIQAIVDEHNRQLSEVASGKPRNLSNGALPMHELVKALLKQHEEEICVTRMKLPVALKKLKEEWVLDAMEEPLWHLADVNIPTRDSPERDILYGHAEDRRMANDIINQSAGDIKQDIQMHEAKMCDIMGDLRGSSWGPIEIDIRRRVCAHMRAMEHADFKLASVREEMIQNIESIRTAKVGLWKLNTFADVNSAISELELAMLSGNYDTKKLVQTDAYLREQKDTMEVDMTNTWNRVQSLVTACQIEEKNLTPGQEDIWDVKPDTQDGHLQLWKKTFELQTLAWKRSHVRGKQLATLENRWKVFHTLIMLKRQEETEKTVSSGDATLMGNLCERIDVIHDRIQEQARLTKVEIAKLLESVHDDQAKLRARKNEQTSDTDAIRDRFLASTFSVMVEDIRLAWLRKEQLQTVELSGLLRKALASSEDQEWLRRLSKIGPSEQTPFSAANWTHNNKGGCFAVLGKICSRTRS